MTLTFPLSSNERRLRLFLGQDLPNGVSVSSSPPVTKGFDIDVNVVLNITIDLTKITTITFALWLASKTAKILANPDMRVEFHGKNIPEDESAATKLIAYEVCDKEHDKSPTG